jgi:hypothetical protein
MRKAETNTPLSYSSKRSSSSHETTTKQMNYEFNPQLHIDKKLASLFPT